LATGLRRLAVVIGLAACLGGLHYLEVGRAARFLRNQGQGGVSLSEVRGIFPAAARFSLPPGGKEAGTVWGKDGRVLGILLYTSPLADAINGYAGPVPLLIGLDPRGVILGVRLVSNWESSDYLARVRRSGLLQHWDGMTWADAREARVDAVTGATLSSQAIIRGLQVRLSGLRSEPFVPAHQIGLWDYVGAGLALLVLGVALTRWRGVPWLRTVLLLTAVGYWGFFSGIFLSMALLAAWVRGGFHWPAQLALGVIGVLAVSVPLLTGRPFYCGYLCPYGAAQELVHKLSPWRGGISAAAARWLARIRWLLLIAIAGLLAGGAAVDLAQFEPFAALTRGFAGVWVVALALAFLLFSLRWARPWCRFCCPTGALLGLLRIR